MSRDVNAWRDDAACLDTDPDAFYSDGRGGSRKDWTYARKVCAGCPVRAECVADALATDDLLGMRGGLAPDELRTLRGKRPPVLLPIQHGTAAGARTHSRRGEAACVPCREAANRVRRERETKAARRTA